MLTHFDWELTPLQLRLPGTPQQLGAPWQTRLEALSPTGRWLARDEWATTGLPAPLRKLLGVGS